MNFDAETKKEKTKLWIQYIITLIMTIGAIAGIVSFTFKSFSDLAKEDIITIGQKSVNESSEKLRNYLLKSISTVNITADLIEHMLKEGKNTEDIKDLLIHFTNNYSRQIGEAFTGFYGYFNDTYIDGVGWVPEEDYIPMERPWYIEAARAKGEIALVPAYVDSQTKSIIISICRRLADKKNVVSLDLTATNLQELLRQVQINNMGTSILLDRTGIVIAKSNDSDIGENYLSDKYWGTEKEKLARLIMASKDKPFHIEMDGKQRMVFTTTIYDNWYVSIIMNEDELFAKVHQTFERNIAISLILFLLIAFFCTANHRNQIRTLNATRAKKSFLAKMSHEIRTPINGILGMNAMIMKETDKESIREYATNIQSTGHFLLSIVSDILDVSKIEAGKMQLENTSYELFSVLNDCYNITSARTHAKNIKFFINTDPMLPSKLYGDEVRIRQIINNLLSNAVKYTEEGSISLSVSFENRPTAHIGLGLETEVMLNVVVKDTGIGIKPENLKKIFENYDRVDNKTNNYLEGTGIGLSITKQLVQMMNGSINVESELGKGSVFTLQIPQIVKSDEPMGNFSDKYKSSMILQSVGNDKLFAPGAQVLVVDDVEINLKVIQGLLKDTKINVDLVSNGKQCLQMVQQNHYDLIFLDHMMPVMDGLETFQKMKDLGDYINKDTPVIMLTANAIVGAKENYLKEGFADYLSKPIKEHDFIRMLKWYLPKNLILTSDDMDSETLTSPTKQNGSENSSTMSSKTKVHRIQTSHTIEGRQRPSTVIFKTITQPIAEPEQISDNNSKMESLEKILDVKQGLSYCINDENFYLQILAEYQTGDKSGELSSYFGSEDWQNYQIAIHALKSSSQTIGATDIAEAAKALEQACKDKRYSYIKSNHSMVIAKYKALLDMIKNCM